MKAAVAGMKLHEHVVLHKFEGDDTEQAPLATITVDDGKITSRCDRHVWLPDAGGKGSGALVCGLCEDVFDGTD